jgi:hypothetical protein
VSEQITVAEVKGLHFDALVEGVPKDHVNTCGTDCADMFDSSTGTITLFEGEKVHSTALEDVKGETVCIDYGGDPTKIDKLALEVQKSLESVECGGS